MTQNSMTSDTRMTEQLREHYEIEKELAGKLLKANRQDRRHLYSSLYNEMYERVPHHPQLTRKTSPEETRQLVAAQMRFISRYLNKEITFLEVGPGDCTLSFEAAKHVKKVYAVDVSDEITKSPTQPANFQLILSDGSTVPVPPNSVNVVYSNQLMEHLHPDDAFEQLENIYRALAPGGVYICITPNRLSGPHDISRHFDKEATGFHLKEYTTRELASLFKRVGFSGVRIYVGASGKYYSPFGFPIYLLEAVLDLLPNGLKKKLARGFPARPFLGIRLVGIK